jgi:hypothetical protein
MHDTVSSWHRWWLSKASVILVMPRGCSGPLATFCIKSLKGLGNGFFVWQGPSYNTISILTGTVMFGALPKVEKKEQKNALKY